MKKILCLIALLALVTGCTPKPDENTTIKVGTLAAESALPIIMAQEQGYYEEEGIKVEIVPFASPQERNAAAQAGEIDGMIADVMSAYTFQEKGFNFMITSDINEEFMILSSPNSGVSLMKELNGKEVALIPGLLLEYIMDVIAEKEGFTYNVLTMPSFSGRFEGLIQDQFEGVVFTQPQSNALIALGAHNLGTSSQYGIKGGAMLFNQEVIEHQPNTLKSFYNAYNKGVDYLNNNDASSYEDILVKNNFPEGMSQYIATRSEKFTYAQEINQTQLQDIANWSLSKQLITNEVVIENAINFSYLSK